MTESMFNAARQRGTARKIGQLNPTGRYGVPEGVSNSLSFSSASMRLLGACDQLIVPGPLAIR